MFTPCPAVLVETGGLSQHENLVARNVTNLGVAVLACRPRRDPSVSAAQYRPGLLGVDGRDRAESGSSAGAGHRRRSEDPMLPSVGGPPASGGACELQEWLGEWDLRFRTTRLSVAVWR